jgi:DNA-binding XRE family transcriptional regulator
MGANKSVVPAKEILAEIRRMKPMRGIDLKEWRKRHKYSQEMLMNELGLGSRQTIVTWEKSSDELPRLTQLALIALEEIPKVRRVHGKRAGAAEKRKWRHHHS